MLPLAVPTPAAWLEVVLADFDAFLLDHASCERKASATGMSFVVRYPDRRELLAPMIAFAREELEHFEQVVGLIRRRGGEFTRQEPSPYAARLMTAARTPQPARLLDQLLCAALIEARSCERMQLLARALERHGGSRPGHPLHELFELYDGLLASEARHHATYVDLARACVEVPEAELQARLRELAEHEAAVLAAAPAEQPRMHGHC